MTEYRARFQCSSGCDVTYPLNRIVYRCERCGGLLKVEHDIELLQKRSAAAWMKTFEDRQFSTQYPYGSGVWGKKEMVNPHVANENVVSMFEGNTNLFWAERFGKEIGVPDLWIKQCGNSHSGSFKDLGMTVLVSQVKQMIAEGQPIRAVACASTGDTSASLAAYCAAAGIPSVVFLPKDKVSHAQLIQPIANGALTLALETDFDGCMKIVQEVTKRHEIYLANSMNSLRIEGQKTISFEIVQQDDWQVPDWMIIPGGNLGNVSALGKGFELMLDLGLITKRPRIVCAQSARANPLYESYLKGFKEFEPMVAGATVASAIRIGNPVSVNKAIRILKAFDGIVEQATEDELSNAAARADRCGLFNCPHTGVALSALLKLVERGVIGENDHVVVISTANGLKFPEFKIKYHESTLEDVTPRYANLPVPLEPNVDKVLKTLDERLK